MKILDIIPYILYPLDSGGNQAVFNMLSAMVQYHEVHLLLRVATDDDKERVEKLQAELPPLHIHVCDERNINVTTQHPPVDVDFTWTMRTFDYFRKSMERKIARRVAKQLKKQKQRQPVEYTWAMRTFDYFRKSMERKIDRRIAKQLKAKEQHHLVEYTWAMRIFDYFRKSMERKIDRRIAKQLKEREKAEQLKTSDKKNADKATDLVRQFTTLYNFLPEISDTYKQFVYDTSRLGFDIIQCEFYETLSLVSLLPPDVKKVFIHHELRYIRNANEMMLLSKVTPADIYTYAQLKDAEISALTHYDTIVTLTSIDKTLLLKERQQFNIYVSPAIVKYDAQPKEFKELSLEMVFVGSANHFPNYNGLIWYCEEVAPLLRKKHGLEPKLYVTGNWDDEKQLQIQHYGANIEFTGFVDDLHEFLNGRLSIVPIRIGSGMRMKILDAIDSSSPVITTSKGCEGLDFKNGIDLCICDNPEDFADTIIDVFNNKEKQAALANNCRKRLHQVFAPEKQIDTRLKLYSSL